MLNAFIDWFIPTDKIRGRTGREMARAFVFTHVFGPLIAAPMPIFLAVIAKGFDIPLILMTVAIGSFWALPFVLRRTGDMHRVALLSFEILAGASLFGTFNYGGFSSPFLPWLIVSLLLGLFYLSKHTTLVIGLFALNIAAFFSAVAIFGMPEHVSIADLKTLGWLSIGSATVYMSWMALYYARIMALRTELELEAERYRATSAELEHARKVAEELSQARSRFFSKMSHELRTPLNAIIGYSDILIEECESEPGTGVARAKDVQRINAAGRHLLSLVSDVLDFDSIEGDVLSVEVSSFTLGTLADEVVASALSGIEKNNNKLTVVCPHRETELQTDIKLVRQILINLLGNAGKFTSNGQVRLELFIEERPRDDRLFAVVTDTGIGIAAETLPRLFTDYEQADASVARKYGGTGIGLAFSRKLSVLLGGEISATSQVGQGACFTLDIPAHLEFEPGHSATDKPGARPPTQSEFRTAVSA